jgi:hypothetical protein
MKSNRKLALAAWLHVLLFLTLPCLAQDKPACEVKVATLAVPDGSDGLLHWRAGNTPTTPLQLSTRYFSEGLKLPGNVIQFYKDPILDETQQDPPPLPLVTLKIPAGQKLVYIVLSSDLDANQQPRWRGNLLNAADWKAGSMKVFNACSESIGITAGKKRIQLLQGKSVDFHASDWRGEAFPVKIFRLKPEMKAIFSSTWRVSAGRRELCFIGGANGSVSLRSLLDLRALSPAAPR